MTGLPATSSFAAPLTMMVFGPGEGESIVIRLESQGQVEWLVIDSAQKRYSEQTVNPALAVLASANARPAFVVLTHPHQDHAKGMCDLVNLSRDGAWVGCVEQLMGELAESELLTDDDDHNARAEGQAALAHHAMSSQWRSGRVRRLNALVETAPVEILGWTISFVHPTEDQAAVAGAALGAGTKPNLNEVSAAILLRRGDQQILLAGDGESGAWSSVEARIAPSHLRRPNPLKVPHHGSKNALRPVVIDPTQAAAREQVVTPFPRSGPLPRFEAGEGAERLILAGGSFHLTAMPVEALPTGPVLSRLAAEEAVAASRKPFGGDDAITFTPLRPGATPAFYEGVRDPSECWVMLEIDEHGNSALSRGAHAATLV